MHESVDSEAFVITSRRGRGALTILGPRTIIVVSMNTPHQAVITSADDPRLVRMGREDVAGADQIAHLIAATPDERLDGLVAMLELIEEAREALQLAS